LPTVHDNPNVDVNDLMATVHDRILRSEERVATAAPSAERPYVYAAELDAASIEALLHTARKISQVRTVWPPKLWVFPFNVSSGLRRLFLRLFAFLFNDQRHVNFALTEALREQLQVTKELHGLIASLQGEVRNLDARVQQLEQRDAGR
jgi:serine phosphatase RsbU (regulator of sigma subunit)